MKSDALNSFNAPSMRGECLSNIEQFSKKYRAARQTYAAALGRHFGQAGDSYLLLCLARLVVRWGEEFLYSFVRGFYIEVPLGKRDRDACLVKRLDQRDRKPALGVEISLHKGPNPQAKIERAFAEALEHHCGSRVLENARIRGGDGEQDLHDLLQIGTMGNPDVDLDPPPRIRQGPVHEFLRDQGCVRNDRISAIARADRARTDADMFDDSGNTADFDGIAGLNRPLEQKNQP